MKKRVLSIRHILLLTFGVLTLLIAIQAGRSVYVEWQRLARVESLTQASRLSDTLFSATEHLSVERDVSVALLHASEADMVESLRQRLLESREATDAAMQMAMWMLRLYAFDELAPLQQNIIERLAVIQTLRTEIDRSLLQPLAERDEQLAARWQDETSSLIAQTQELWIKFVGHFTDINPIVTQHLRYKHFLRIITDYTGRERAIIGRLIAENADPTPEEFAELLRGQGIIELSWRINRLLADQSGLYPLVESYYKDAQSHYQNLYGMVRDIFYLPNARHGETYPISADLWLELSTQATESLDALKAASVKGAQHYIGTLEKEAWRTITQQGLFLLFALIFCAWGFQLIVRRVLLPVERMIEALLAAMRGEQSRVVPPADLGDEIGKLAQILHAFQRNMDAIQQSAAEIRESRERYRALVESSAQIIWTWKEGAIDKASPLSQWWEATTGLPSETIATFGWLDVVHPDDRDHVRKIWEDAMAKGANFDMEYRLRAQDGHYLHVAVKGVALHAADGSVREFIGSLNDVTARKEAEEGLRAYTQALERSNKELDDFAYIASHDLKEPLRGIHNHSRFLLEDNQDKLDEESTKKLNRLVYLSQRMERLVNDLLYFSRLGRQELAIGPTDMNAVIHDIENTLDIFLAERQARIVIPKSLPTVTCDKPRVTELFRNLITNAIKYNDKPEKMVEVGWLAQHASGQGVTYKNVFYVKDDGNGIAPEFHEEIFRIFKRLQGAKDGIEEGTGVGLTFVKKIVERHGGKIWLESRPGQGTIFYFTLEGAYYDTVKAA
jgi:PAS domain S-box-containing protein